MSIPVKYTMVNTGELANEFCNMLNLKNTFGVLVLCGDVPLGAIQDPGDDSYILDPVDNDYIQDPGV